MKRVGRESGKDKDGKREESEKEGNGKKIE